MTVTGASPVTSVTSFVRGRAGLAVVGVVVLLLVLAIGALLGGWRPFSGAPRVVTYGPGGDLAEFVLFEGQCATGGLGPGGTFGVASNAQCGNPHDVEVVATEAPIGEGREVDYPGEGELADYGRAYCGMIAESKLLQDSSGGVDRGDLTMTAVIPSEAAFLSPRQAGSAAGGRQVTCVVSRADGEKLTDRFSVI